MIEVSEMEKSGFEERGINESLEFITSILNEFKGTKEIRIYRADELGNQGQHNLKNYYLFVRR